MATVELLLSEDTADTASASATVVAGGIDVRRTEVEVAGAGARGARSSRPVVADATSIVERTAEVGPAEQEVRHSTRTSLCIETIIALRSRCGTV